MYDFLKLMSKEQFAALIVAMIAAGRDNFEPIDPTDEDAVLAYEHAMETISHQVAVFFAQRYNVGVPTDDPMHSIPFTAINQNRDEADELLASAVAAYVFDFERENWGRRLFDERY